MFANLNNPLNIENGEMMKTIQEFTCNIYGFKNCSDVNLARLLNFEKQFATQVNEEQFFKKVKNYDSSLMPSCWKSLKQKNLRTIYVTSMWQNATNKNCILYDISECGWICNDNDGIRPNWFEGSPTPLLVEGILLNDEKENESEDEDEDNSRYISDSDEEN